MANASLLPAADSSPVPAPRKRYAVPAPPERPPVPAPRQCPPKAAFWERPQVPVLLERPPPPPKCPRPQSAPKCPCLQSAPASRAPPSARASRAPPSRTPAIEARAGAGASEADSPWPPEHPDPVLSPCPSRPPERAPPPSPLPPYWILHGVGCLWVWVIILTFSSRSCCLNSSSSSESQSGNWYTLIANFSISSLTLNRRMKNIGYIRSPDTWSEDAACVWMWTECDPLYLVLHLPHLRWRQTVSLGNERNHVHLVLQCSHKLHVHGPQPGGRGASEWHTLFTLLSKKIDI